MRKFVKFCEIFGSVNPYSSNVILDRKSGVVVTVLVSEYRVEVRLDRGGHGGFGFGSDRGLGEGEVEDGGEILDRTCFVLCMYFAFTQF